MKTDDVNRLIDQRQALALEALDEMVAENQRLGLYDDAVNMTQECVDKTAKGEHDLWIAAACLKSTVEAAIKAGDWKVDGACDPTKDLQYLANCLSSIQDRKWVGLTDDEREFFKGIGFVGVDIIEAKLKEKNT